MSCILRPLTKADLPLKYSIMNKTCSYNELHSTLGYPRTEMEIEFESQAKTYEEYLIEAGTLGPIGLIRVGSHDDLARTVPVQALLLERQPDAVSVFSKGLNELLMSLVNFHNVTRMYSFLFPDETDEAEILRQNGFDLEASLRRHIHIGGRYHDLMVFGTGRRVK